MKIEKKSYKGKNSQNKNMFRVCLLLKKIYIALLVGVALQMPENFQITFKKEKQLIAPKI